MDEEGEKHYTLPTKQEIIKKAIALYMKDHPEAAEHGLTPEILELKAREGGYLEKARDELMRGSVTIEMEQLQKYLSALREEVEKTVERLRELGVSPHWPPPSPDALLKEQTTLENRIAALELKVEKTTREKQILEEKLKTLQKTEQATIIHMPVSPQPQPAGMPEQSKQLREEAYRLWDAYINATLTGNIETASETAKRLRQIRVKLK